MERYMRRALELAQRGWGTTRPNPMVGAVLVREGQVVGEGYHRVAGGPHAEVEALAVAGERARGAQLFVTLEPCCHWGRTPPCVDALIRNGIRQVFIALEDPDPRVSGMGIRALEDAGIEVRVGLLETEARRLNEVFVKYATTRIPFTVMKSAATLDGKIASGTGDSRWVTSEASRKHVHHLRRGYDAILVGINTVLADDPELTVRWGLAGSNPLRVVLDSRARIPENARMLQGDQAPVILATTRQAPEEKLRRLESQGIRVKVLGERRVDLTALMPVLGDDGITGVFVEGGGTVNAALLKERLVDKVLYFLAPKLLGGWDSPTALEGPRVATMAEAIPLEDVDVRRFGEDILVEGYPVYREV